MTNFLNEQYYILGVKMDVITREILLEKIDKAVENKKNLVIFTPYSEYIYRAQIEETFKNVLNAADLSTADGVFIQIASIYYESVKKTRSQVINYFKLLGLCIRMVTKHIDRGIVFPELLSGSAEVQSIAENAELMGHSVYLVGGAQNVVYVAAQKLKQKYPTLNIVGTQVGTAYSADDKYLFEDISVKKPDVLMVCYGSQKEERWVIEFKEKIHAKVIIGLGGTFDYVSEKRKLQSQWWSDHGLNWLHRLISEPVRWRRQIIIFRLLWILAGVTENKNDNLI